MHSQIILTPYISLDNTVNSDGTVKPGLNEYMERYAQTLRLDQAMAHTYHTCSSCQVSTFTCNRSKGCTPYVIPLGGCTIVGIWGFVECFRELIDQVSSTHI